MILIAGLGNPGRRYLETRHNIGRLVVDEFARKNNFPNFRFQEKFNALISKGILNGNKIILGLPETFMNNSGHSIKSLVRYYRLQTSGLWVFHDDVDLTLGKIKIVKNRGAGGHKGVESIIKELKTKDFVRFRIGIQPERGKQKNVEKLVLQKFNKKEEQIIKKVVKAAIHSIEIALKENLDKAMQKYN